MPNYCIGQIYLISNAIFISFVLPWFESYPDFLIELLSLLFEPHIAVFSVYGEPESAGPSSSGLSCRTISFVRNV